MPSKLIQRRETEAARVEKRKKWKRILVIVGVLIVGVTFIVKEIFRDQLKDSSDRIGTALASVEKQESVTTSEARLMSLNKQITQLNVLLESIKEGERVTPGQVAEGVTAMTQMYVDASDMVDLVSAVQDALPNQGDILPKQRTKVRDDLGKLQTSLRKIETDNHLVVKPTWKNHADTVVGQLEVLMFEFQAWTWQAAVVAQAEKIRGADDALYRACTWAWYGLAFIGGVVGLIGIFLNSEES